MKKLILLLCTFLNLMVFGVEVDKYQLKIENMLAGQEIIYIDKDKIYGTYIDSEEETKINQNIITQCINVFQNKNLLKYHSIFGEYGINYSVDKKNANGYYYLNTEKGFTDVYVFDNGKFTEFYRNSKRHDDLTVSGMYNVELFNNITYHNFINKENNLTILDSMDRIHYFFELNGNKEISMSFMSIKDHIERVAILKDIKSNKLSIIYKVYKIVKVFYSTGELMIDANFECFAEQNYKEIYNAFEDPKSNVGTGIILLRYPVYYTNIKSFTFKANKFNIFNKDGTNRKEIEDSINIKDPFTSDYDQYIVHFFSNNGQI